MDEKTSQNSSSFQSQSVVQAQSPIQKRRLSSIGNLFSKTWQVYKSLFGKLIAIMSIGVGFYILVGLISILIGVGGSFGLRLISYSQIMNKIGNWSIFVLLFLIIFLGSIIVYSWVTISVLYVIKEREHKLSIGKALKKGWSRVSSYLWIGFLVSLCITGGTILLVIPGIIFLVWFDFAQCLLVDQDIKGAKALSQSRELVRGYWWPVFGRIVLMILIVAGISVVLKFVPFIGSLLLLLVINPFVIVFYFILYEDLKRIKGGQLLKSETII